MTYRTLSALAFALIVAAEIILFVAQPTPTKEVSTGQPRKGLFGGIETVTDYSAQQDRNQKNITIIGVTVIMGGIITFALPNKRKA